MIWLVTGSSGFIGKNLVRSLRDEGESVIEFDLLHGNDVRRHSHFARLCPDVVVHLAAISGIQQFDEDIHRGLSTNVGGTAVVSSLGYRVVSASSGAVYGGGDRLKESARLSPANMYGWSKVAAEAFPHVSLRFSNVYGPHCEGKTSAVHKFVRDKLSGSPLRIYGDGSQVRDFVYVGDVVRAIKLAAKSNYRGALNISSGDGVSVRRLAQIVGGDITFAEARPGDVSVSVLSNDLARDVLGWLPEVQLEQGVEKVVEWMS